jgi:hypothetical protein
MKLIVFWGPQDKADLQTPEEVLWENHTHASPKCSRPSFSSSYDMTRVSGTSSLLTVRTL